MNEEKRKQIIALGQLGWTTRRIEKATGVRRETVAGYLRVAGLEVRNPGWGGRRSKPAIEATTDSGTVNPAAGGLAEAETETARPGAGSLCEPYRELIETAVSRDRNAVSVYQELTDRYGFRGSYQSVKRFVRRLSAGRAAEACAVIETAPGEESQVDYGTGPMVRHPESGKYRRTRLFVFTLGFSRKCVRLLTFQSGSQIWCELHERAFHRLGGVTRTVILDNLKEGVLKPDIWDPALNPLYRDMLAHYGMVALPCMVRDPDRKGKVESGVGHTQKTPLKGQRFETLEEAQAHLDHWDQRWADTRIHGTTKRQVSAMFAEEKPALLPLPCGPFRYYRHGERTVHLDGCVEVEAAYYSAPPGWIGRRVKVQFDGVHVRLLDPVSGQLLREHLRTGRGSRRIPAEDRPKQMERSTASLLARAAQAGEYTGKLCAELYRRERETAIRRIQGVLSFAGKYGVARTEEACRAALETQAVTYGFVRSWLERVTQPPVSLRQIDPLIRQLTLYRDLIGNIPQENTQP